MNEAASLSSVGPLAAPWTGVTLAELFTSTVRMNSHSLALCGPASNGLRRLTYGEAAAVVERIIQRLEELIIDPGAPIAIAMPCVIEAPLAIVAVLQAGFMPCLLPAGLEVETMREALAGCHARAVVTIGAVGPLRPAERARAACVFEDGPRYVLAFGDKLPGGVIPLDTESHLSQETAVRARPAPPRFVAPPIMTLGMRGGRPTWVRQDQEGLVATALTMILRGGIGSGEPILSTLAPVTAAGLATGMVPALLTGGSLHLPGLFSSDVFVDMVGAAGKPHVVVPATLELPMRQAGLVEGGELAGLVVVHRAPARLEGDPTPARAAPVIDALALGEQGLLLARRPSGGRPAISLGETRIPDDGEGALVLASRQLMTGEVEVAGAAAGMPAEDRPRAFETEWTETGVLVACDPEGLIIAASAVDAPCG